MVQGFADPDGDGPGWRLVLTLTGEVRYPRLVRAGSRDVLLLPRAGEGWWAVGTDCARCRAPLTLPAACTAIEQLPCTACGHVHVPDGDDTGGPPVMTVDDEIYLLCD